jgi:hypothetical protein
MERDKRTTTDGTDDAADGASLINPKPQTLVPDGNKSVRGAEPWLNSKS